MKPSRALQVVWLRWQGGDEIGVHDGGAGEQVETGDDLFLARRELNDHGVAGDFGAAPRGGGHGEERQARTAHAVEAEIVASLAAVGGEDGGDLGGVDDAAAAERDDGGVPAGGDPFRAALRVPFVGVGSDSVPGLGVDAGFFQSGEETLGVACRGHAGIGDDKRPSAPNSRRSAGTSARQPGPKSRVGGTLSLIPAALLESIARWAAATIARASMCREGASPRGADRFAEAVGNSDPHDRCRMLGEHDLGDRAAQAAEHAVVLDGHHGAGLGRGGGDRGAVQRFDGVEVEHPGADPFAASCSPACTASQTIWQPEAMRVTSEPSRRRTALPISNS